MFETANDRTDYLYIPCKLKPTLIQIMHITFLGLDNARELVYRHCRQMLLNLMIVLGDHGDHLTVSSILMNSKTDAREFGLSLPPLPNVLIREENHTIVPVPHSFFYVRCGTALRMSLTPCCFLVRNIF